MKRPYQVVELRMDIVPYDEDEADLYDHETAFFLRCGKAKEWDKWESGTLHRIQFVLYLIKANKEAEFLRAFEKHSKQGNPRMIVTFHPASSAPAKLGADGATDSLIFVRSNTALSGGQVDDLFDAVQGAARDVGGAMCPVRDQHGQAVDPNQSKWSRFKKKMHI
ncbi:uncharacterized protein I303_103867 [Kwoniella dejecticola CBS 10117]|uniref:Uncharacterized protein n=1 Tax=Kwoniella dejecticola CBS 10117 TaxID=1296121 RepID=A0A1A6A7Y5_9TREE|nr:uncharacterized protein I303_03886 [Kwoniella dejecticola CBS 10117]OBR86166.1 hypothetical protein I303_03886 [Kwoniella dejecticola CBS 10117]